MHNRVSRVARREQCLETGLQFTRLFDEFTAIDPARQNNVCEDEFNVRVRFELFEC